MKLNPPNAFPTGGYPNTVGAEEVLSYRLQVLSRTMQRDIKRGKLDIEDSIDLHGMYVEQASVELMAFLEECSNDGLRYLLIVHGKGTRSDPSRITLKSWVNHWLRDLPNLLAFHSAHAKHGGTGAVYVVLKRERS